MWQRDASDSHVASWGGRPSRGRDPAWKGVCMVSVDLGIRQCVYVTNEFVMEMRCCGQLLHFFMFFYDYKDACDHISDC